VDEPSFELKPTNVIGARTSSQLQAQAYNVIGARTSSQNISYDLSFQASFDWHQFKPVVCKITLISYSIHVPS
jgi:hypothetical protein